MSMRTQRWLGGGALIATLGSVIAIFGSGPASGQGVPADQVRYRVDTTITLGIVDDEGLFEEDEHCGFSGGTAQVLRPVEGVVQLGTGRPEVDYPFNSGPFRDTVGEAVRFFCGGEVSACFSPATAVVTSAGVATISMLATLYEGDQVILPPGPVPCHAGDRKADQQITLTVPEGTRVCLAAPVQLRSGDDRLDIGAFCASNIRLDDVAVTPSPTVGLTPLAGPPPQAVLSGPVRACPGHAEVYDGSASTGRIREYRWDFGDGTLLLTGTLVPAVPHTYTTSGVFTARLTVVGYDGQTGSASILVRTGSPYCTAPRPADRSAR